MSWEPKRYDPPQDELEPCPKCSWADWEKAIWPVYGLVIFYLLIFIAAGGAR